MTRFVTPASNVRFVHEKAFPVNLTITLGLAELADWLFYRERVGISVVVFAIVLACGSLLANFARLNRKQLLSAGILFFTGLLPAVEECNPASLAFVVLALSVGLLLTTSRNLDNLGEQAVSLCDLFLIGPFRFLRDVVRVFNLPALTRGFTVWLVPVCLGSIFVLLFVAANPLLERWISLMNPGNAGSYVSLARMLFWVGALSIVWPFVDVWWRHKAAAPASSTQPASQDDATISEFASFFGVATILRSLVLFNLLFAVQTALDGIYLWGNVALPADITYAAYAHRGAYPLIFTALLAAGFVLAAMKPGGPAEQSKVIRPLVYLWVAQNVLLVTSSILRLDLYVQIYMLTWWRIAAFVWMLLVALGLLLIVARIILRRSNDWLIHVNLIALTATLYLCSLVNFAAIIADYNVSHSREASGNGVQIDTNYLFQLGPPALPAIDKTLGMRAFDPFLAARRDSLLQEHQKDMASWRTWGLRNWRLQRYLDRSNNSTTR